MLFRVVRPMRRSGTRNRQFVQRIPADVTARAVGIKLAIPLAGSFVVLRVTDKTKTIRFSLRTDDPSHAKSRNAEAAAYLEGVWRSLREDVPVSLTAKQAHALAGILYLAWANEEEGERTISGTIGFDGAWTPEPPPLPHEMAAAWENLREKLDALPADDAEALEGTLGPIVDRLLLTHGIRKVDSHSRLILLGAFRDALRDAAVSRQRQAEGDYSPDPQAGRFPAWQPPGEPSKPATAGTAEVTLTGLVESWWIEAKAARRTQSTYESYRNTMGRLVAFLKHDDASRVTVADVIAFKDHRLAEGVSPKTVGDSDIAGLRSVFTWAVANRKMATNPTEGVKVTRAKTVRTRTKAFTAEEATAVLKHATEVTRGREHPKLFAAKRWVPWLCAYTGARVGEIVQLRKEDVKQQGGAWTITITPEAGTVKDKEVREVVLHEHLADLGFLGFVKGSKPGHLFLTPKQDGDVRGPWRTAKNRLVEFVREVITDERVQPNHAWRHTFKTVGRQAGIEDSVLDAICGHAPGTVGGDYGEVTLEAQVRAFERFPRFTL